MRFIAIIILLLSSNLLARAQDPYGIGEVLETRRDNMGVFVNEGAVNYYLDHPDQQMNLLFYFFWKEDVSFDVLNKIFAKNRLPDGALTPMLKHIKATKVFFPYDLISVFQEHFMVFYLFDMLLSWQESYNNNRIFFTQKLEEISRSPEQDMVRRLVYSHYSQKPYVYRPGIYDVLFLTTEQRLVAFNKGLHWLHLDKLYRLEREITITLNRPLDDVERMILLLGLSVDPVLRFAKWRGNLSSAVMNDLNAHTQSFMSRQMTADHWSLLYKRYEIFWKVLSSPVFALPLVSAGTWNERKNNWAAGENDPHNDLFFRAACFLLNQQNLSLFEKAILILSHDLDLVAIVHRALAMIPVNDQVLNPVSRGFLEKRQGFDLQFFSNQMRELFAAFPDVLSRLPSLEDLATLPLGSSSKRPYDLGPVGAALRPLLPTLIPDQLGSGPPQ